MMHPLLKMRRKLERERMMEKRKPKSKPPPAKQEMIIPGEELAKLSIPELIQLIGVILQEIEIRSMENAD